MKTIMREMTKKIFIFVCILSMLVSVMPGVDVSAKTTVKKVKSFSYEEKSGLNKMKLKWKKQKGVSYYIIYRVDATKYISKDLYPKESKYKKIAKVTGKKSKYTDNNVKRGRYYSYIIKGYKKKAGKDKLICSTFSKDSMTYNTVALETPAVENAGYGEDYNNSAKKIYLYATNDCGMEPTGYIFYRKEVGKKSYKKIGTLNSNSSVFIDDTVKGGKTYRYKVKSYLKVGKKIYYSKRSQYMQISSVNFYASYTVKALSKASSDASMISFKLKSTKKYNGDTVIKQGTGVYYYQENESSYPLEYNFRLTKYSLDNITWKNIPKKGIILKAKQTVYLQGQLSNRYTSFDDEEIPNIYFGGSTSYISNIEFDMGGIEYKSPGEGYTEATFDFITGRGNAYLEWD